MSWLSDTELKRLIKRFASADAKKAFIGVFAIDELPKSIPHLPVMLVVNTDSKNLPGKHWNVVFISPKRHGEVFDSLSLPISIHLMKWLNNFTHGNWKQNKKSIQHPLSSICGVYELYFILNRLKCKKMESITKEFGSTSSVNDKKMLQFWSSLRNKRSLS